MKWQGHDQTDLQYQGRGCVHRKGMPATGKAWAWGPWPHFKKKKTLLVWTCGGLVLTCGVFLWCSKNSMWCRWGPGGGPSWNGRNWLKTTAVSWSSRQMTLKKGAPGDQVWDLLSMQLASYLEGDPLMRMISWTCMLIKNPNMIWAWTHENLSSGVCEQQRHRPAQYDQHLCYSLIGMYNIQTSYMYKRNFIFLASFCSWVDWFESHFVWNPKYRFCRDEAHMYTNTCR